MSMSMCGPRCGRPGTAAWRPVAAVRDPGPPGGALCAPCELAQSIGERKVKVQPYFRHRPLACDTMPHNGADLLHPLSIAPLRRALGVALPHPARAPGGMDRRGGHGAPPGWRAGPEALERRRDPWARDRGGSHRKIGARVEALRLRSGEPRGVAAER